MGKVLENFSKAIAKGLSLFGKIISTILVALYAAFLTTTSIIIILNALNMPANVVSLAASMVFIVLFLLLACMGLYHILHVEKPRKLWDYVEIVGVLILFVIFFSLIPVGLFMGFLEALIKYFKMLFRDEKLFNFMVILNTAVFWVIVFAFMKKETSLSEQT